MYLWLLGSDRIVDWYGLKKNVIILPLVTCLILQGLCFSHLIETEFLVKMSIRV